MKFEEQAKVILKRKPKDKVASFLKSCEEIPHSQILSDVYYKPSDHLEIEGLTDALKHMRELKKLETSSKPYIDPIALDEGIERAKFFLDLNKTLNTGGKPSSLSVDDIKKLMVL